MIFPMFKMRKLKLREMKGSENQISELGTVRVPFYTVLGLYEKA